jgi:O-antigen ligase
VIKVWPWAVDDFLESPLIGTGFSSFNDRYKDPSKVFPGIKLRLLDKNVYNSGHAHHSFLNILAEQGLIGLLIFIFFNILFISINENSTKFRERFINFSSCGSDPDVDYRA